MKKQIKPAFALTIVDKRKNSIEPTEIYIRQQLEGYIPAKHEEIKKVKITIVK